MRVLKFLAIAAAAATLAGCLGGGGGTAAAPELRGTAAIGAPLADATVTLRGANGNEEVVTANAMGQFVFTAAQLNNLTAPAMLRAVGNAGGTSHTLFSVASTLPAAGSSSVANVTPLTHAVTQQVMGSDLAPVFAGFDSPTDLNVPRLDAAIDRVLEVLELAIVAVGVPGANPFTTSFSADQTGLDKLLDLIEFRYASGNLTVTIKGTSDIRVVPTIGDAPAQLAPSPVLGLDLTGIKPFITRFNDANDDVRATLFDPDFRHDGISRAAFITALGGADISEPAINGCTLNANVATCTVNGRLSFTNANLNP